MPPPDGPTRLKVRMQNGVDDGLPGVRLVLGMGEAAQETVSDEAGYFQFDELNLDELAGPGTLAAQLRLLVDGSTAEAEGAFATVPKEVHIIAGVDNLMEAPIILMPLDVASADPVNPAATSALAGARGWSSFKNYYKNC